MRLLYLLTFLTLLTNPLLATDLQVSIFDKTTPRKETDQGKIATKTTEAEIEAKTPVTGAKTPTTETEPQIEEEDPSLSEWIKRISQSKSNLEIGPNIPNYMSMFSSFSSSSPEVPVSPLISKNPEVVHNKIQSLLEWYKTHIVSQLSQKELWIAKKNKWKNEAGTFQPYSERYPLNEDSRVFLFGDFHGDILSFGKYLESLRARGFLGEDFRLSSPNLSLVFLGDYTDRGHYGLEVIYTVLRLIQANPDQVKAVRGNHEDTDITSQYGFQGELRKKIPENHFYSLRSSFGEFYELMPVVIYFGREGDWVQGCHGGLETGYNPDPLLKSQNGEKFDLVNPLDRQSFYTLVEENGKNQILSFIPRHSRTSSEPFYLPEPHIGDKSLGFMWNDFLFDPHGESYYHDSRGFKYNKNFTEESLPLMSSYLRGVVRAHQHSGQTIERLATHGLFRYWYQDEAEQEILPFEQGNVFMFNVGVDSCYWHLQNHTLSTFGELQMAPDFSQWRMARHTVSLEALKVAFQAKEVEKHLKQLKQVEINRKRAEQATKEKADTLSSEAKQTKKKNKNKATKNKKRDCAIL